MLRNILLGLNQFVHVPTSLRTAPNINSAKGQIEIDIPQVCHHLYLDTYGYTPPDPNPAYGLYAPMFTSGPELRVTGEGLGSHKEAKIGEYNKFGKAFCRWFLYEHCNITYFAHMDQILGNKIIPDFNDLAC